MSISDKKKKQIAEKSVQTYGAMYSYSDRIDQAAEFFATAKDDFDSCDNEFNDTFWNSIMNHHEEVKKELDAVLGDSLNKASKTAEKDYLDGLSNNVFLEGKSELMLKGLLSHVDDSTSNGIYTNSPFGELHRNPAAHFKAYCLSKGMSLEDFITLRKEPDSDKSKEIKEKMDKLTVPFLQGVMHPDEKERIKFASDMYVGFIKQMDQEIPAITQKIAKGTNQDFLDYAFVLKGIATSICMQTLNLGEGTSQSDQQKQVMENVTEQLKKDNVNLTLDHIHSIGTLGDLLIGYMQEDNISKDIKNYDINSPQIQKFTKLSDYMIGAKKYLSDQVQNNGGKGFSGTALTKEVGQVFMNIKNGIEFNEALTDSIDTAQARMAQMFPHAASKVDDLQNKLSRMQDAMKNNVRKNIFGKPKKHSPEYQDILNKLDNIKESDAKDKSNLYKELLTACTTYLGKRDPNSSVGQDRYGMVMQVENLARTMYQNAASYIPEDIKGVLKDAPKIQNSASKVNFNKFSERCINGDDIKRSRSMTMKNAQTKSQVNKQNDDNKLSKSTTVTESQSKKHHK